MKSLRIFQIKLSRHSIVQKIFFYCSILVLFFNVTFGQPRSNSVKKIEADCEKAINVTSAINGKYGPTVPPNGYGSIQEFENKNYSNKTKIEFEHNSAWYFFNATENGKLNLTIIPKNKVNDYDFMLYKAIDSNFCQNIKSVKNVPIRSNLSRTGKGLSEITGLHINGKSDFVSPGIGNPFSKLIDVKKGEQFYLVLDNIDEKASGHTIIVGYEKKVVFSGKLKTDNNKTLIGATVKLKDEFGNVISETKSINEGNYKIETEINPNLNYAISVSSEKKFPMVISLNKETIAIKKFNLSSLNGSLPTLLINEKYVMDGIYFVASSDVVLESSYNSMEVLCQMMLENKTLKIRIEGHINDPGSKTFKDSIEAGILLSERRAIKIYNFLMERNIAKERITYIGLGNKFMVYPNPKDEYEMEKNRRVEINVVSF